MSFRDKVFNKYLNNYSDSEHSNYSYNSLNDSEYSNNNTYFNIDNISDSYRTSKSNVELQSVSDLFSLSDSDSWLNNSDSDLESNCNLIDSNIQNDYVKKYHKKESFIHMLFKLIKKIFKLNKKKNKIGKGNNTNEINYQYDISDLVNQVK